MERFIASLEGGWDNGVEYYEQAYGENFWTRLYWYAFKYADNNDIDGGVCFEMREDAINNLTKSLEKGE